MTPRRNAASLRLQTLETREVPSGNRLFAIAEDMGGSRVSVYQATGPIPTFAPPAIDGSGQHLVTWEPYGKLGGGVRVAVGDVTGDGVEDVITAPGAGGAHIKVYDGNALLQGNATTVSEFFAYDAAFRGGAFVAVGQFNPASPALEIVTGAGASGGSHVKVFALTYPGESGLHLNTTNDFFAFDERFRGGVRVAAGDVTGDGRAEVIAAAGPGGGPHVRIFQVYPPNPLALYAYTYKLEQEFFAYDPSFRGGVYVAAGEMNGNPATAEVVTGAGEGGGPHVKVYSRQESLGKLVTYTEFFASYAEDRGGVRVGFANLQSRPDRQSLFVGLGPREVTLDYIAGVDPRLASFTYYDGGYHNSVIQVPPQFDSIFRTGLNVGL